MDVEFDGDKDAANLDRHRISLAQADEFNLETASTRKDDRADYGETRFIAIGFIGARLHVLIFVLRPPKLRAISLRKANARERKRYDQGQDNPR